MKSRQLNAFLKTLMIIAVALLSVSSMLLFHGNAEAAVFTVSNNADSGAGSLRQAILDANALMNECIIRFNIAGEGVHRITMSSPLPVISNKVLIEGSTQSSEQGIHIEIYGNYVQGDGLSFAEGSNESSVDGIAIFGFNGNGISIQNTDSIEIANCHIGTDASGTTPEIGNTENGVLIHASEDCFIGENDNGVSVVSGNGEHGILIRSESADNSIRNTLIGVGADSLTAIPNMKSGISVNYSSGTLIGDDSAENGNTISGNAENGIEIIASELNEVSGNHIGVSINGEDINPIPNNGIGIMINNESQMNSVGQSESYGFGAENVIAFNGQEGILIDSSFLNNVRRNVIVFNFSHGIRLSNSLENNIGEISLSQNQNLVFFNHGNGILSEYSDSNTFSGNHIILNGENGISLYESYDNDIGCDRSLGFGNAISLNALHGIAIERSGGNAVVGNKIGTNPDASSANGNELSGVFMVDCNNDESGSSVIGGHDPKYRNIISGNGEHGIHLTDCSLVEIIGNFIGSDLEGENAIPNNGSGIHAEAEESENEAISIINNLISGNGSHGLSIADSFFSIIADNNVGTCVNGKSAVPNTESGISLERCFLSIIGPDNEDNGNLISGNLEDGISLDGCSFTVINGNRIGTDRKGQYSLGNGENGIRITDNSILCFVGLPGSEGNLISGNSMSGLLIEDSSFGNTVSANKIGTDFEGKSPIPNMSGITIAGNSDDNTIGGDAEAANNISYNDLHGVAVLNCSQNAIVSNTIWNNGNQGILIARAFGASASIGAYKPGNTLQNLISKNSIYNNGMLGIELVNGANDSYPAPVFSRSTFPIINNRTEVSGTSLPGSSIELFYVGNDPDPSGCGEGYSFLEETEADEHGFFSFELTEIVPGTQISATATSPDSYVKGEWNTSQFSLNAIITEASLEAVKTISDANPVPGGFIDYLITINNNGNGEAYPVSFFDEIPNHTRAVLGSLTCSDENAVICEEDPVSIGNIYVGARESVTISFRVAIDETVEPKTIISNQGIVSYGGTDLRTSDPDHPNEGRPTLISIISKEFSHSWYVAEGSTGGGFDTWLLIQNPNDESASVEIVFTNEEGPQKEISFILEAESRKTIRVLDYLPDEWSVSSIVHSDSEIVVERSMYWNKYFIGESETRGTPAPSEMRSGHSNMGVRISKEIVAGSYAEINRTHYFPEGATGGGFDTWILLVNPNEEKANALVTLMTAEGPVVEEQVTLNPLCRATVHLDKYLPDAIEVATSVESDLPLIAERSMYWDRKEIEIEAYEMTGGHCNAGSPKADTEWLLAEGSTGEGFETYILIQNPQEVSANVHVGFLGENGEEARVSVDMVAKSRRTLRVYDYVPDSFHVSTIVTSEIPVVAERSTYWNSTIASETYQMRDGHSTVGAAESGKLWLVPEGSSAGGFDTYILIANSEPNNANAIVTLMTTEGPLEKISVVIPSLSRTTLRLSDFASGLQEVSAKISSDTDIVVERSMYWNTNEQSTSGLYRIMPYEMMGGNCSSGFLCKETE